MDKNDFSKLFQTDDLLLEILIFTDLWTKKIFLNDLKKRALPHYTDIYGYMDNYY